MTLPFTTTEFFDVFARYHRAVWPAPAALLGIAVISVVLVLAGRARTRAVTVVLALLWAWMAVAYHFAFFSAINPAAWLFGAAFLVAAVLFLVAALRRSLYFEPPRSVGGLAGMVLVVYALVGYPLVGWGVGHAYPRVPTFGLPCPTTIFTLGLLLLARRPVPKALFVVPLAWSVVGSFAAFRFGVVQDYGLPVAAWVTVVVLATLRRAGVPSSRRPEDRFPTTPEGAHRKNPYPAA
jgi:hypothetical protein